MSNDRSWVGLYKTDPRFKAGVLEFLKFARENNGSSSGLYPYVCIKCMNMGERLSEEDIYIHLVTNGMKGTYTVWDKHGEIIGLDSHHGYTIAHQGTYFNYEHGGTGTIKQINLVYEGERSSYVKYYVHALDENACEYSYSLIEGDQLNNELKKITYEVKFEGLENGGIISKVTSKYYTVGDSVVDEEEVKAGKDKAWGTYRLVEAYLVESPQVYV